MMKGTMGCNPMIPKGMLVLQKDPLVPQRGVSPPSFGLAYLVLHLPDRVGTSKFPDA